MSSQMFHSLSLTLWLRLTWMVLVVGIASGHPNPESSLRGQSQGVGVPWIGPEQIPGEPLSPNDFQNADALQVLTQHGSGLQPGQTDPIELAGLFEGDIILSTDQVPPHADPARNAIMKETQKWSGGLIPYAISAQFNPLERSVLARAFLDYQRQTCIKFLPRTTETDYIHIMKGTGCSSHVGRTGGDQPVILGNGCVYPGIATHELMHAIGFWHEQSRWDRDEHVSVFYTNIAQGMDFNFRKYSWRDIQNMSAPYDTGSILHYGPYAFSKNKNLPTIVPKTPNDKMGQRDGLSKIDIWKINKLYNCDGSHSVGSTTETPGGGGNKPTEPPQVGKCSDSHQHCISWSEQGQCTKNPMWMKVNCRKSCNTCDSPCVDSNDYCPVWEQGGECKRNPHYMNTYCPKSCGTCVGTGPQTSDVTETESLIPECSDVSEDCSDWAAAGECQVNPKYMVQNCRKSCQLCLQMNDTGGSENENEIISSSTL